MHPTLDDKLREKIITELFSDWLKQQIEYLKIVTQVDGKANLQLQKEILHPA